MIGALISAGASLAGGFLNRESTKDANAASLAHAREQMQQQKDFAKKGIRWKVEDAKKAGIHPLYALGANTVSYSPVTAGQTVDTSMGSALASAGQDISRAVSAGASPKARVDEFTQATQALSLEKFALENELLKSQIAKTNAQLPPPTPNLAPTTLKEGKIDDTTPVVAGGYKLAPHAGFSDGQTFEDRWGEWGGSTAGLAVMAADLIKAGADIARRDTRITRVPRQRGDWIPRFEFR